MQQRHLCSLEALHCQVQVVHTMSKLGYSGATAYMLGVVQNMVRLLVTNKRVAAGHSLACNSKDSGLLTLARRSRTITCTVWYAPSQLIH